jgi:hypothetical protein
MLGCSDGATVCGSVTWEEKDLDRGWITFYPADRRGSAIGAEVVQGRYQVTGMVPGKKRVRIGALPEAVRVPSGKTETVRLLPPRDPVPEDAIGNNQTVEVKRGRQNIDFVLKKPAR